MVVVGQRLSIYTFGPQYYSMVVHRQRLSTCTFGLTFYPSGCLGQRLSKGTFLSFVFPLSLLLDIALKLGIVSCTQYLFSVPILCLYLYHFLSHSFVVWDSTCLSPLTSCCECEGLGSSVLSV
jgi:hypothetical protein